MFNVEVHKRKETLAEYLEQNPRPTGYVAARHCAYCDAPVREGEGKETPAGVIHNWHAETCVTCGHPEAEHDGLEECRVGDCYCRRYE